MKKNQTLLKIGAGIALLLISIVMILSTSVSQKQQTTKAKAETTISCNNICDISATNCHEGGSCGRLGQYCEQATQNPPQCNPGGPHIRVFQCFDEGGGVMQWHEQGEQDGGCCFNGMCNGPTLTPQPTGPACNNPFQTDFHLTGRAPVPGENVTCTITAQGSCNLCQGLVREKSCVIAPGAVDCSMADFDCDCNPFAAECTYNGNRIFSTTFPGHNGQTTNFDIPELPSQTPTPTQPVVPPGCGGVCNNGQCGAGLVCVDTVQGTHICSLPDNQTVGQCEEFGTYEACCTIPAATPTPQASPSPQVTPPYACTPGQTQCSNCGGDVGHCAPDCNGGWCNGGICQTCEYNPPGGRCTPGVDCICRPGGTQCDICEDANGNRLPSCPSNQCRQGTNGPGVCSQPANWQRGEPYLCSSCGTPPTPPPQSTPTATPRPTNTPPPGSTATPTPRGNTPTPTRTPTPRPPTPTPTCSVGGKTCPPTPTSALRPSPTPTKSTVPTSVPKPSATPTKVPTATPIPLPRGCGYSPCDDTTNVCAAGLKCIEATDRKKYCIMPQYENQCYYNPSMTTCCYPPTATPIPPATNTPVPQPTTVYIVISNTPYPVTVTPAPTYIANASPVPTIPGTTAAPTVPSVGSPLPLVAVIVPIVLVALAFLL